MLEKIIDSAGKASVVVIPVSEAAKQVGWVISADTVQTIAAVGALVMIADKFIRLAWARSDRKKRERQELK